MRLLVFLAIVVISFSALTQQEMLFLAQKVSISSSRFIEYGFVPTKKGAFFITDRSSANVVQVKDMNNSSLNRIYYSSKKTKSFSLPKLIELKFEGHIGSFSVNEDENSIVFTGRKSKTSKIIGLFISEKQKGKWSNPKALFEDFAPFNLMDPHVSKNQDTLYFASDLPGGFGGLDIYMCQGTKGNWSKPVNLGSEINTSKNERFPARSGDIFYCSSNREGGLGGWDIYFSEIKNGSFSSLKNFAAPINSSKDDFSCSFGKNHEMYFSSNRNGNDDIFQLVSNYPDFECVPEIEIERCYEFSEENTESNDTSLYRFEWKMGDGTIFDKTSFEYCYKDKGEYVVELNIYDRAGDTIVSEPFVYLLEIIDPMQLALILPNMINSSNEYVFRVECPLKADSIKYYWDFGDGKFAYGQEAKHSYFKKGSFEIAVGVILYIEGIENKMCTSKNIIAY